MSSNTNGYQADLGNKIEDYCLNPKHQKGKHKAILFQSKLGITLENADLLKKAIKQAAIIETVIIRKTNEHGTHYNMKFLLKTNVGESLILVAWVIRTNENDNPRPINAIGQWLCHHEGIKVSHIPLPL